jgi:hypothetical protein
MEKSQSTGFTSQVSLVRIQYRPPDIFPVPTYKSTAYHLFSLFKQVKPEYIPLSGIFPDSNEGAGLPRR